MPGRLLLVAVLAALPLLAATACGASDEEQVRDTVKRFYRAAAEGDGEEACAQLSTAALGGAGVSQCEAAIDQLGELGGPETRRRLAEVSVRNTRVTGDRATTQARVAGQTPVTLALRKVDGEWKLESLGTQFGASLGPVAGGT